MNPKSQFQIPNIADLPVDYLNQVRQQAGTQDAKERELTPEQERRMQDGFAIEEMSRTAGWQVIKDLLEGMAFHSWVDPRTVDAGNGSSKEEWVWRELNAFYMSNNAKELLETIRSLIEEAHQLQQLKLGEIAPSQRMRF